MPLLTILNTLTPRSPLTDAQTTLSSWPACMSKPYCKWPVIACIILASLIALSLLWCALRCLCCGLACCPACLACCDCCGICAACCRPRRRRRRKEPNYKVPPENASSGWGGYAAPPQMTYGGPGPGPGPGYARFDAPSGRVPPQGGAFSADALPAMPSWDAAPRRRVEVEEEDEEGDAAAKEIGVEEMRVPPGGLDGEQEGVPLVAVPGNRYYNPAQAGGGAAPEPEMAAFLMPPPPVPIPTQTAEGRSLHEIDTRSQPPRSMYEVDAQSMRHPGVARGYAPRYLEGTPDAMYGFGPKGSGQERYAPDGQVYGREGRRDGSGEGNFGYTGQEGNSFGYQGYQGYSQERFGASPPAASTVSPVSQQYQQRGNPSGVVRKPVQGSWRDV